MGKFGHAVYWVDGDDEDVTREMYGPYAANLCEQGAITIGRSAALNIADLARDDPDAALRYLSHLLDGITSLMAAVPRIHETQKRRIMIEEKTRAEHDRQVREHEAWMNRDS